MQIGDATSSAWPWMRWRVNWVCRSAHCLLARVCSSSRHDDAAKSEIAELVVSRGCWKTIAALGSELHSGVACFKLWHDDTNISKVFVASNRPTRGRWYWIAGPMIDHRFPY